MIFESFLSIYRHVEEGKRVGEEESSFQTYRSGIRKTILDLLIYAKWLIVRTKTLFLQ